MLGNVDEGPPRPRITQRDLEQAINRLRPETRWFRPTGRRLQRRPTPSYAGAFPGSSSAMPAAAAAFMSGPRRPVPPPPPTPSPRQMLQREGTSNPASTSRSEFQHDAHFSHQHGAREEEQRPPSQDCPALVSNIARLKEELFQDRGPLYFPTPRVTPRTKFQPSSRRYENLEPNDNAKTQSSHRYENVMPIANMEESPPPVPPRRDLMNRGTGSELTRFPVDPGDSDSFEEYFSTHEDQPDPPPPRPPPMPPIPPRGHMSYQQQQQQLREQNYSYRPPVASRTPRGPIISQAHSHASSYHTSPDLHYSDPATEPRSRHHRYDEPQNLYQPNNYGPPTRTETQQPYSQPPPPPPRDYSQSQPPAHVYYSPQYQPTSQMPPPRPPRTSRFSSQHPLDPGQGQSAYFAPPYTASPGHYGDAFTEMMREQSRQNRILIARQSTANKLPEFHGNPMEWQSFISHYKDQNAVCSFTREEITGRLDRALKGEARQLVMGLLLVRNNPEAIIARLEERYGRPEYVIHALMEVVKKTPPLKSNLNALQDFSATVNNLVSNIKSMDMPAYLHNPSLIKELVDKLPDALKFEWGKFLIGKPYYSLNDFSEWMRFNATATSMVSIPSFTYEDSARNRNRGKGIKSESSFVAAAASEPDKSEAPYKTYAKSQQQPNKPPPDCPACKKGKHKLWSCESFKKLGVDDRWEVVKKAKLCFKCLSSGHVVTDCKGRSCAVANCNGRHNSLLHGSSVSGRQSANAQSTAQPASTSAEKSANSGTQLEEMNGNINAMSAVQLRVIPVKLYGPSESIIVNAILDDCSTVTMISSEVAAKIGLTGPVDPLRIQWTNGTTQEDRSSMRIIKGFKIGPIKGEAKYKLRNARTMQNLLLPQSIADYSKILKSYPHFSGIKIHTLHNQAPLILIGQRHSHLTIARGVREGDPEHPMATKTKLGWVVHGNLPRGMEKDGNLGIFQDSTYSCIHESDDELLQNLVKEQFALESIGISTVTSNRSREDKEAEELMDAITRRVDGRWETGLLWRNSTGFSSLSVTANLNKQPDREPITAGGMSEVRQGAVPVECGPMSASSATTEGTGISCRVLSAVDFTSFQHTPSVGESNTGPGFRLPPSRETAFRRMLSLERKFRKEPDLKLLFQSKIDDYLVKGYARKLTPDEAGVPSEREWFLPLFGTFHPNKPGKLRLIWDAASKSHSRCLNDFLLTGPDLLASLPGILLKFRRGKFAFSGDITEMFHQVRIRQEDCPAQRFLWRSSPEMEPSTYQLEVMMFGSVCSPYCAQYVKNMNAREFADSHPDAAHAIINHHYMDDYLESCHSIEGAFKLIGDVTKIHGLGGFHISKWVANSPEILESIPPDQRASSMKDLTSWSEIPTERALGLHWNPGSDMLTFRVNLDRAGEGIASGERIPTKRAILRLLMLVWDPLGFLAHYLVTARIIIQHLWRMKVGWDDEIPSEVFQKWKRWVRQLVSIRDVTIPRHYSPKIENAQIQLHIFADASESAYACVAYFRICDGKEVDLAFILAKARVAPLKPTTIPRLELQAAQIGARMGNFIRQEQQLPISSCHFWTDSGTVLKWIRNSARRFQQFVANRIGEIHEVTDVSQWRWVPSKLNPADDATREGHADLSSSSRWWKGPEFLWKPEEEWPIEPECHVGEDGDDLELRKEFVSVQFQAPAFSFLPDVTRFSNYQRLLRASAYVRLPFILQKWKRDKTAPKPDMPLQLAETQLIIRSQWKWFGEEMGLLSMKMDIPKTSSLYKLSPLLDDMGMLRMRSRLAAVEDEGLRHPIILHPKDDLTRLLIHHYHRQAHHHSSNYVLNEMRQKYWITSAKTTIKQVIRNCGVCRLRNVKLPKPPIMADLPRFRIQQQQRPFTIVGMDYFGPLFVTVKRSHEKRYGVLFTCLSTRAIHLEIAHDLTTDACIMAIRRFIGRRGQPKEIHSDNGTNLRGADKELRLSLDQLNQSKLKGELEIKNIAWFFVPPSSPHMAGVWERLVRSVKNALSAILKERFPKDEVLRTVFAEAEAIVNSRPLTDVPIDADVPEAITPFHFLIGTSSMIQPPGVFQEREADFGKKWRQAQALLDMFWTRWRKEFLPTLQLRQKWRDAVPNLEVGDVVVLFDESLRRGSYPLGLITSVIPGKDGVVRVVWVKTATGHYQRSSVKIAKIGVKSKGNMETRNSILYKNEGEDFCMEKSGSEEAVEGLGYSADKGNEGTR